MEFNRKIPVWKDGYWVDPVEYDDPKYLHDELAEIFMEPGQYGFTEEVSEAFNQQARDFRSNNNVYCMAAYLTSDFITYWDGEKAKCINGAFFYQGNNKWYLPRDYYMWLNFLPIFDKIKGRFDFPLVWDVQYHMSLYEDLALLIGKNAVVVKKRQIASSFFHCAKIINRLWFDEGAKLKLAASLSSYIEDDWNFLESYRDFLNENTAWYRPMSPNTRLNWMQQIEIKDPHTRRSSKIGNKSNIKGISLENNPTKGVGGPTSLMFVDEAGLLANLNKTYEFVRPSMYMGSVKTGQFIAAGSVGELDDAEPIKNMLLHPQGVDAYIVQSDLIDENRTTGETALFIPEQWGMPPFIDKAGNSLVQEALAELNREFEQYRQTLSPEEYQLRISQHPRNIKECFAVRELSIFPTNIIQDQMLKIQDKQYPYELVELDEDVVKNEIIVRHTNRHPINEWPVKKTSLDKRGAIQVWERPDKDAPNGTYIASIDPVNVGKTTTSDSLCSIYVYKMPVEVTKVKEEGNETFVEGDKIVCAWCGRYDDIDETNRQLRLILEWYKCEALVENNVPTFITYMQHEKKQQYLTTSDKMLFLKEYVGKNGYQTYGWRNTNTLFKNNILPYLIEYLCDVLDEERDENGVLIRKIFGATRIPDNMAFVEMLGYNENANCDRLIALASLIAYSRIKLANEKRKVRVDYENKNLAVSKNLYKFTSTAFRNIGRSKYSGMSISRSPFKHLR